MQVVRGANDAHAMHVSPHARNAWVGLGAAWSRIPTFHDDNHIVVKCVEHLLESPLVMAGNLIVTLELFLTPRQANVGEVRVLYEWDTNTGHENMGEHTQEVLK